MIYLAGNRARIHHLQVLSYIFGALTPGSETFFHGIEALRPASDHVFAEGQPEPAASAVWDPFAAGEETAPTASSVAEILMGATRSHVAELGPLTCDVTGGLDSRLSLAVYSRAAQEAGVPLSTQTTGDPLSEEVSLARAVARAVGSKHYVLRYDQQRDLVPVARALDGPKAPIWRQTSGQGRHSYIYFRWIAGEIRKRFNSVEINSLGGELAKGIYYGHGDGDSSSTVGMQDEVEAAIARTIFDSKYNSLLRDASEHFLAEGYKDRPHGLSPLKATDWWAWRNRFCRAWSPRYHMTLKFGRIHYPLLDHRFLCHVLPARADILRGGRLLGETTQFVRPELTRLPYRSGHQHSLHLYRPSIFRRAMKRASRMIGHQITEPGDPFFFRRIVKEQWRDSSDRLAQTLPLFAPIGKKVIESDVLLGGSADMRLYYLTRFLDDLIHVQGADITDD